jgi:hypothetical protein
MVQMRFHDATILFFLSRCFFVVGISLWTTDSLGLDSTRHSTEEMAISRAMQYTGFDRLKNTPDTALTTRAELVIIEEDRTPFLADSVIGKKVWKVHIGGVKLDLPDWYAVDSQPERTFEILIDAETGRCFGAYVRCGGCDPNLSPEPPSDTATKLMGSSEVFVGFPNEPPPVTLAEALNAAVGSNPVQAKEIVAVCVMWSHLGQPAIPVWSIIGRGIPPVDFRDSDKLRPLYQRNRMRTVVDATNGRPIMVENGPPVVSPPGE